MALEDVMLVATSFLSNMSLAEARASLEPMIILVIGIVIYSIFIFKFYRFVARRDIFRLPKTKNPGTGRKILYGLEYIFLFPIVAFIWFLVISVLLSVLSDVIAIGNIFMISMTLIVSIRITAYHHEELSRDLAKLIPFALLAVILLDISRVSAEVLFRVLNDLPAMATVLVYYFVFITVLELVLRFIVWIAGRIKQRAATKSE